MQAYNHFSDRKTVTPERNMTEFAYQYDMPREDRTPDEWYMTPEARAVRDERARRAAAEEAKQAARMADFRRLAVEGLSNVANLNPKVSVDKELEEIDKVHASGNSNSLQH